MIKIYNSIMNPEINPLSRLPKVTRFQIMTLLSVMWSIVFCAWTGLYSILGASILGHTLVVMAIFFTASVFQHFSIANIVDHRRHYRDSTDNCALYDDVWGG